MLKQETASLRNPQHRSHRSANHEPIKLPLRKKKTWTQPRYACLSWAFLTDLEIVWWAEHVLISGGHLYTETLAIVAKCWMIPHYNINLKCKKVDKEKNIYSLAYVHICMHIWIHICIHMLHIHVRVYIQSIFICPLCILIDMRKYMYTHLITYAWNVAITRPFATGPDG